MGELNNNINNIVLDPLNNVQLIDVTKYDVNTNYVITVSNLYDTISSTNLSKMYYIPIPTNVKKIIIIAESGSVYAFLNSLNNMQKNSMPDFSNNHISRYLINKNKINIYLRDNDMNYLYILYNNRSGEQLNYNIYFEFNVFNTDKSLSRINNPADAFYTGLLDYTDYPINFVQGNKPFHIDNITQGLLSIYEKSIYFNYRITLSYPLLLNSNYILINKDPDNIGIILQFGLDDDNLTLIHTSDALYNITNISINDYIINNNIDNAYCFSITLRYKNNNTNISPNDIKNTIFLMKEKDNSFYYNKLYNKYNNIPLITGGSILASSTGLNATNNKRARTDDYYILSALEYIVWDNAKYKYIIVFYDKNKNQIGYIVDYTNSCTKIKDRAPNNTYYIRFVCCVTHGNKKCDLDNFPEYTYIFINNNIIIDNTTNINIDNNTYFQVIPENIGVLNAISRAEQVTNIIYTISNILPNQINDYETNSTITGIPYSSSRKELLYVPQCVSFDSFMTAIMNPNSYIYNRFTDNENQISLKNSKTYYGSVCSAFVSYILNLPCVYTTHQIGELEDFELVEDQSPYGLSLGSILLHRDNHIAICTGIIKNYRGRIYKIQISEATTPLVRSRWYTPETVINNYLSKNFVIYNYKKIYSIPYERTQWINVEDESALTPSYNNYVFPRRGDKANWRKNENIEIDILNNEIYTQYEVYKDDILILSNIDIPNNNLIILSNLSYGKYKIRLTNGIDNSDFAYFIICDYNISVDLLENNMIKLNFSSENCTAVYYTINYTHNTSIGRANDRDLYAIYRAYELSNIDKNNGYVIFECPSDSWYFAVHFKTEFGEISSDFSDEYIIN